MPHASLLWMPLLLGGGEGCCTFYCAHVLLVAPPHRRAAKTRRQMPEKRLREAGYNPRDKRLVLSPDDLAQTLKEVRRCLGVDAGCCCCWWWCVYRRRG